MEGNMEEVKRLVGRHIGSDKSSLSDFVDASDDQGNAAVHGCAFAGHLSILQFLVEDCGADALSVRNDLGCTPLWLAAGYGHLDVLKYLLGRIEAVSSLVISPAEIVMGENSTGDSPLLAATSRGHVEVCRLILQAVDKYSGEQGEGSANAIRRTNQNGDTPLAVAVGAGHADELLDLFLQRDACICTTEDRALNMRNKNGLTPLLVACERNLAPIALKLIEAGALPLSDSNGASPLAVAAFCGCDDVVEALLNIEFGKQLLNKQDDSGKCTPLWLAARTGNAKMVRLLLDAGADATLTNIDGLTPEEAAVKYDKKKVMEVFGYDIQEVTQEENAAVDDSNQ
jgi:ankyrin repeat protein